jgi:hypothetical protein
MSTTMAPPVRLLVGAALFGLTACSIEPSPRELPAAAPQDLELIEPAYGDTAQAAAIDQPLTLRELAYTIVAMVDVEAERPMDQPDEPGTGTLRVRDPCRGIDVAPRFGAAIIAGRDQDHVYLATADHVASVRTDVPRRRPAR